MASVSGAAVDPQENSVSLAGTWRFRLDPENVGVEEKWFAEKLDDSVTLPGTTDTNHKGIFKDERAVDRLSRVWYWKGPAWYQRDVVIPDAWKGKRITLLLERTKNTRVWVDDKDCGAEDTLSAPQIFDLTAALTPGRHTITVLVDNAKLPPVGPSHAVDERTQSNWNGIVGRLELRATDPVWLEDVQVYPDAAGTRLRVRAVVGNITGRPAKGKLTVGGESYNVAAPAAFPTQSVDVQAPERRSVVECIYQPGEAVPLWDEFQPAMVRLDLKLAADRRRSVLRRPADGQLRPARFQAGRRAPHDQRADGLPARPDRQRQLPADRLSADGQGRLATGARDHQGMGPQPRPLSLVVPAGGGIRGGRRTGHVFPGRTSEQEERLQGSGKPDGGAAGTSITSTSPSADPNVSLYDYARREGELIFRHFGNHPSFVMFTLGNELGRDPAMFELVARFREARPAAPLRPGVQQHALGAELCRGRRLLGDRQDRQDASRARCVLLGGFSRGRPHRVPRPFDADRLPRLDRRRPRAGHRS